MVILIADDDRLARFALKSMLLELELQGLEIHEVSNGKRLVEQCRQLQPDIAFVDITMPHLDGLSAIAQCKSHASNTQFVIVTGYSDFAYAHKSIELQVADYLLKPIEQEQLRSVVRRLTDQLLQVRQNENLTFSARVSQYFHLWEEVGYCPQEDPCAGVPGRYYGFLFYLDAPTVSKEYKTAYLALTDGLRSFGRKLSASRVPHMLWEPRNAGLDFIVRSEERSLDSLCRHLERICAGIAKPRLAVSCVYVQGVDLWSLYQAIKDADKRAEYRFGLPCGSVCAMDALLFTPEEHGLLKAAAALTEAYQEANESRYEKALKSLRQLPETTVCTLDPQKLVQLLGICMNGRFFWDGSLSDLHRQLLRHKDQMYTGSVCTETDRFSEILHYVDSHYMEDLSLTQLAEKMELTPNYFSKVFHDRTGKTFSAYLTEVRIAQAKRILLVRRDVLVKDVAIMVGYFSYRHFTNVFKKMTGCYPSEFRKQNETIKEEGSL